MKIICSLYSYYLSEVSRLLKMGQVLYELGQEVIFFSHGGNYEYVAQEAGFEVVAVEPHISPGRVKHRPSIPWPSIAARRVIPFGIVSTPTMN